MYFKSKLNVCGKQLREIRTFQMLHFPAYCLLVIMKLSLWKVDFLEYYCVFDPINNKIAMNDRVIVR